MKWNQTFINYSYVLPKDVTVNLLINKSKRDAIPEQVQVRIEKSVVENVIFVFYKNSIRDEVSRWWISYSFKY